LVGFVEVAGFEEGGAGAVGDLEEMLGCCLNVGGFSVPGLPWAFLRQCSALSWASCP
jgi:hypothetical protein